MDPEVGRASKRLCSAFDATFEKDTRDTASRNQSNSGVKRWTTRDWCHIYKAGTETPQQQYEMLHNGDLDAKEMCPDLSNKLLGQLLMDYTSTYDKLARVQARVASLEQAQEEAVSRLQQFEEGKSAVNSYLDTLEVFTNDIHVASMALGKFYSAFSQASGVLAAQPFLMGDSDGATPAPQQQVTPATPAADEECLMDLEEINNSIELGVAKRFIGGSGDACATLISVTVPDGTQDQKGNPIQNGMYYLKKELIEILNRLLPSWNKKRDTNSLVRRPSLDFNLHRRDVERATWALSDASQGDEEWLLDRKRYACQNASKGVSFVSVSNLDDIISTLKGQLRKKGRDAAVVTSHEQALDALLSHLQTTDTHQQEEALNIDMPPEQLVQGEDGQ
eukprot:jgi/Picre1/29675/NNA_005058.t1